MRQNGFDVSDTSYFVYVNGYTKAQEGFRWNKRQRGVKISGGEAQRICLARALIRKPKVLILDEATSSLDSHSELLIKESIENLTGETTIICIAHRLSTIQSADRIYYLEAGKIIEEGTFKELIDRKENSFRKTAKLQGIV